MLPISARLAHALDDAGFISPHILLSGAIAIELQASGHALRPRQIARRALPNIICLQSQVRADDSRCSPKIYAYLHSPFQVFFI